MVFFDKNDSSHHISSKIFEESLLELKRKNLLSIESIYTLSILFNLIFFQFCLLIQMLNTHEEIQNIEKAIIK